MTQATFPKILTSLVVALLAFGLVAGFLIGRSSTSTVTETSRETVTKTFVNTEVRAQTIIQTVLRTETVTQQFREPEVKYAKFFGLTRGDGYILLRDSHNRTILAVPKNIPVPNIKADVVVRTPIERAVLMSATHVALVERLREFEPELLKRVAGLMWGRSYEWYFPAVAKSLESGLIKDVGASWSPDYEQIVALKPDLVMIYSFPGDQIASKLEELKIPYVVNNEYMETHPLGRFEWIKFVGALFGLEKEAYMIFHFVESNYLIISAGARNLVERGVVSAPKVVWFSVFRGTVYVAGDDSYVAKLLQDLGAVYAFSDVRRTASATVSIEELVRRALDADVIIISTDLIRSREDLLKEVPQLSESKAFRQNQVYRYNSNIFQLGYFAAEEYFKELASLLYPGHIDYNELYDFFVRLG
ncbi:MAG: ABC transporter substrate-binding protein [Candidatus Caldarchaeum sp.]